MLQIKDFSKDMIPLALRLLKENYREEQLVVPALPVNPPLPPLEELAQNGLGVAAIEDGRLLGFLGAYGPWSPVFCTKDTRGVFSPLHAHAVQADDRIRLWRRLYQAAAEKWARAGAASHAITLYAHDNDAKDALYLYGFGVRCMDFIRPAQAMTPLRPLIVCRELPDGQRTEVNPLRRALAAHLAQSPCFMQHDPRILDRYIERRTAGQTDIFVAEADGRIAAFMEVCAEGENFAANAPGTLSICGAYCQSEYRGTGMAQSLLSHLIDACAQKGAVRIGVDCESINPTALCFWSRHFTAYTHSVVRRIDENAVGHAMNARARY